VLILPYWEGRHPDHYTASVLGYEASFLAGLAKLVLSSQLSVLSEPSTDSALPHRPFKIFMPACIATCDLRLLSTSRISLKRGLHR